jgi:hypothetical protein
LRFVSIKSANQQAQPAVHRMRQGFVEQRTALINRRRGLILPTNEWVASARLSSGRRFTRPHDRV